MSAMKTIPEFPSKQERIQLATRMKEVRVNISLVQVSREADTTIRYASLAEQSKPIPIDHFRRISNWVSGLESPAKNDIHVNQGISAIAKQIILDELEEQAHIESVEDVIFWALEHYAKRGERTNGELVAYSIVQRIEEAEIEHQQRNN